MESSSLRSHQRTTAIAPARAIISTPHVPLQGVKLSTDASTAAFLSATQKDASRSSPTLSWASESETMPPKKSLKIFVDVRLYPGATGNVSDYSVTVDEDAGARLYEIFEREPRSLFWIERYGSIRRVPKVISWDRLCDLGYISKASDSSGAVGRDIVQSTIIIYLYPESLLRRWQVIIRVIVCVVAVIYLSRAIPKGTQIEGAIAALTWMGFQLAMFFFLQIAIYSVSPMESQFGTPLQVSGAFDFFSLFFGYNDDMFNLLSATQHHTPHSPSVNTSLTPTQQTAPKESLTFHVKIGLDPHSSSYNERSMIVEVGAVIRLYRLFKREPKALFWKEASHLGYRMKRVPKTLSWDKLREMEFVKKTPDSQGRESIQEFPPDISIYLYPDSLFRRWQRIIRVIVLSLASLCCLFFSCYVPEGSQAEGYNITGPKWLLLGWASYFFFSIAIHSSKSLENYLGPPVEFGSDCDFVSLFMKYSAQTVDDYHQVFGPPGQAIQG